MTMSVNLAPNSECYTLGPDIPVNTGFFQILPVILVTQQYDLYLGLLGWTIYLLVVVLHDYIPSSPSSVMPHGVVVAVAVVVLHGVSRSPSLCHVGVTVAVVAPCLALCDVAQPNKD